MCFVAIRFFVSFPASLINFKNIAGVILPCRTLLLFSSTRRLPFSFNFVSLTSVIDFAVRKFVSYVLLFKM